MFDSRGRLDIFENFVVDRSLPKHRPKQTAAFTITNNNTFTVLSGSGVSIVRQEDGETAPTPASVARRLWQRLWDWIRDRRRIPIEAFFSSIKNGVEELEVVEHRLKGYLAAIAQAEKNGQTALAEQLKENVEGVRTETQLVAMKLRKYITEEQLVQFVKKAKKGLRLDWVKNFTRVIPENVIRAKEAADDRDLFDNYVVLHFDPQAKAWAETQADKEAKRDPILFGVLKGRRRLYFVGDWVDEFCDLTFDQIADTLGESTPVLPMEFDARKVG